jgi:hypothetical protein
MAMPAISAAAMVRASARLSNRGAVDTTAYLAPAAAPQPSRARKVDNKTNATTVSALRKSTIVGDAPTPRRQQRRVPSRAHDCGNIG